MTGIKIIVVALTLSTCLTFSYSEANNRFFNRTAIRSTIYGDTFTLKELSVFVNNSCIGLNKSFAGYSLREYCHSLLKVLKQIIGSITREYLDKLSYMINNHCESTDQSPIGKLLKEYCGYIFTSTMLLENRDKCLSPNKV